jgi:large subunit ribosomal protein L24
MSLKIKKGDTVQVISGRDAGKQGKISQVFPRQHMVVVEGVNIRFKHVRTRRQNEMGQRIQFAAPLLIDKVQLVCPHCNKPARISINNSEQGRTRMCKKCHQAV